jgi:dipeptidyl aminopeptidase/acylaminoacyl peptidase
MRWVPALGVACLACGRLSFDVRTGAVDGAAIDVPPPDPFPTGPFGARIAHPELDVDAFQDDVTLSDDQLEIYFAVATSATAPADIYRATRVLPSGPFGTPTPVIELNSTGHDGSVWLSEDGLSMMFSTDRAGVANDYDIWTATRATRLSPWTVGGPMPGINQPTRSDNHGRMNAARTRLISFTSNLSLSLDSTELLEARRATAADTWSSQAPIAELNTSVADAAPSLSDDFRVIVFASNRPGSQDLDLYIAARPDLDTPFGVPTRLAELATTAREEDPWLSPDGRTLFFASGGSVFETSR